MVAEHKKIIEAAYAFFNARDINKILALMHVDIVWPNGWEGGYVNGKDEVKAYWTRQWKELDPNVEPVAFTETENGKLSVDVHQIVRDHSGRILADTIVKHVYTFDEGLIKSMEIKQG